MKGVLRWGKEDRTGGNDWPCARPAPHHLTKPLFSIHNLHNIFRGMFWLRWIAGRHVCQSSIILQEGSIWRAGNLLSGILKRVILKDHLKLSYPDLPEPPPICGRHPPSTCSRPFQPFLFYSHHNHNCLPPLLQKFFQIIHILLDWEGYNKWI